MSKNRLKRIIAYILVGALTVSLVPAEVVPRVVYAEGTATEDNEGETGTDVTGQLDSIYAEKEKTIYYVGDEISWDDLTVKAVYKDETGKLTEKVLVEKTSDVSSGYIISSDVIEKKAGRYEVEVSYSEGDGDSLKTVTATIIILVLDKEKMELSAVKEQEIVYLGETTPWDDLRVLATYKDEKNNILYSTNVEQATEEKTDGYKLKNVDAIDYSKCGIYTVTVEYEDKSAPIDIKVVTLLGISAEKTTNVYSKYDYQTQYMEDSFWADLSVIAEYSYGDEENSLQVVLSPDKMKNCMIDKEIDVSSNGEKKIRILYSEGEGEYKVTKETILVITIKDVLTSLLVNSGEIQKTFTVKNIKIDNLVVTAVYNNDPKNPNYKRVLNADEYTTNIDALNKNTSGKYDLVISYKEEDVTKEVKVKITLKVPDVPVKDGVRTANVLDFAADPSDLLTDKVAIQDALDIAETSSEPVVVYIPAGDYYIGNPLYIHSNTTIKMADGARIVRNSPLKSGDGRDGINHNMLKAANSKKVTNAIGGYDNVKNIVLEGGTWDGGDIAQAKDDSNVINIGHAENVTIRNTTIKNCYGNHLIEFAGVKNAEVYNCYFTGFREMKGGVESEAIQIDVCYTDPQTGSQWNAAYKSDNTFCDSISIHNNTFVDYPVSVGNHHLLNGSHHKNISIYENTITNKIGTGYQGVFLYGCDNSVIANNVISGFENGLKAYGSLDYLMNGNTISNCEFGIVSAGRSTGAIKSNAISDTIYEGIFVYESTVVSAVSDNKLEKVGVGAGKTRDGITVRGNGTVVNNITNNVIKKTNRHGIYVDTGAKVSKITGNTISDVKSSGVYVTDAPAKVTVKSNKLTSVGSNAVKIANKSIKQSYTFAPKVKLLNLKKGRMDIESSNLKKVQLKFKSKSYSKSTKKKKYTLKFKAYKKKVKTATVLFTDKNKNVVTRTVTIK